MSYLAKNNKIYWYIIILVSLFILVLVTKNQFSSIQIKKDEILVNKINEISLWEEVNRLNEIRNKILNEDNDINKYIVDVSEDLIIESIYSKIEKDNNSNNNNPWDLVKILNLTMYKWGVNDLWFKELTLNLNLTVPSEDRMIKLLDYFTWDEAEYKFFITSFSYPSLNNNSFFNVNIPLKIFYK
jgi:hypothetical protein